MRLVAPCQSLDFRTKDIYGNDFRLSNLIGKRVMLAFFRDAACPFCNYRIYELTQKHQEWKAAGMEVVVVFTDTKEQVRELVAKRPRPFTMICDPKLKLYNRYGVEKSWPALLKAILFNAPEIIRGFLKGAKPTNNPHMSVVPADFLIEVDGKVVDLWYGKNTADHMPFDRLLEFGSKEEINNNKELLNALKDLRNQNRERAKLVNEAAKQTADKSQ